MNRSRWILVAAVAAIAVLGALWWRSRAAGAAPRYRTVEIDRGNVESVVSATGTIKPVVQVTVGSQVSGTVEKINADYNSRVRAGEVILQLEQSSFRAREVQAEAAVAKAAAGVRDGERQLARSQELFKQSYVSQADLDNATVTLQQRKADLQQTEAQLQSAKVDLDHTTIRAPIDGVVIARSVDVGQTVAASLQAPQLFLIANDLTQMQVETKIDEADIGQIRPGLPVSFTVDAFPDREFDGQVSQVRLEPVTDQNVVTYTTVIRTANQDLKLRPGMTANVTVRIEKRTDVLRVPNAALRFRPPSNGDARTPGGAMAAGVGGGDGGAGGRKGGAPGDSSRGGGMGQRGGGMRGGDANTPGTDLVRRGPAGAAGRGLKAAAEPGTVTPAVEPPAYRPGVVYVLREGKPEKSRITTGITDGAYTEIQSDVLKAGDRVIIGFDQGSRAANNTLQPPPGMGGFRGPGGGGGGGGRGR